MNSIHPDSRTCGYSPWPHRVATVLVCVTFPLIWVGGLVTTYDAGMAVPDWPGTYGYNLFLYPVSTWLAGPWDLFIEHGHRLLASAVGMITIAARDRHMAGRRSPLGARFMLAALGLVIGQGVLGGLRVLLDETLLARLHGCVGPLFFASTVVAAAITSRWWRDAQPTLASPETARFSRLAWFTAAIAYAQLVLGAHLRHIPFGSPPTTFRGLVLAHLLVAALLVAHVGMLAIKGLRSRQIRPCRLLRRPLYVLAALTAHPIVVGCCDVATEVRLAELAAPTRGTQGIHGDGRKHAPNGDDDSPRGIGISNRRNGSSAGDSQ